MQDGAKATQVQLHEGRVKALVPWEPALRRAQCVQTDERMAALCGVKAIAGGYGEVSYAIDATCQLLGWGRNENGWLGDSATSSHLLPVKVLVPSTMF